ncbi:MAG: ribonuclease III [SAR86 cluster bacterium]|uniref:Ribonuclease 3 n=1 Tax=SAR86 cluster bacterium TaxID=2030880 RepID=A0A2A4X001_9GAMM|nr:MAG: ribonuclease III [SAR86 cluster bacterium]
MVNKLEILQQSLAYQFSNPDLAQLALTHRSANAAHNERLEFLGDALLGFIVAETLFTLNPQASEGELSRMRSALVNKNALAAAARSLGIGEYLQLGTGEANSGGSDRDSILADTVEALIAAIYLDGGIDSCTTFVKKISESKLAIDAAATEQKDAKTRLQEFLQAQGKNLPKYTVVEISGAAHEQVFHVSCRLESLGAESTGSGTSKREAEQQAAKNILEAIEVTTD